MLCAAFAGLGCRTAEPPARPVKLQHLPPTGKDVIGAVLDSSQVQLADASCLGYGTEAGDKTLGRYLAGYLVELSNQDARNAVQTTVEPGMEKGQPVYVCRLMIRHAQGEDVWSWGVQFSVGRNDGVVLTQSIQCIGAG